MILGEFDPLPLPGGLRAYGADLHLVETDFPDCSEQADANNGLPGGERDGQTGGLFPPFEAPREWPDRLGPQLRPPVVIKGDHGKRPLSTALAKSDVRR